MKIGIQLVELNVDPTKPPLFKFDVHELGRLVDVYASVEKASSLVGSKQPYRLVPVFVFEVNKDAPMEQRAFIILGHDGFIEDERAMLAATFINPIDRGLFAVFEVPIDLLRSVEEEAACEPETKPDVLAAIEKARETQEKAP